MRVLILIFLPISLMSLMPIYNFDLVNPSLIGFQLV